MRIFTPIATFLLALTLTTTANAFCGFYVARADGELFNDASKVVFVRDGKKSVITMSSDYRGAAKDFAMIVPTPAVLKRKQVRTVKPATITHLDQYSAPRLVEYFDEDPCLPQVGIMFNFGAQMEEEVMVESGPSRGPKALGVTIEAQYAVGIYDILMLSAKQSDGLITWLKQEKYNIPDGAEDVLQMYIKGGMKFFVARVNLKRHASAKVQELQPLQISFSSENFMLPIQLGKINSAGEQDLLLMTLTRTGRVETANYPTKRIPTDVNIPVYVKDMFPAFYKATFARASGGSGVLLEYAWDMAWCDPCAADPLSREELKELGVSWLKGGDDAGQDVFVTRLHLRYTAQTFLEDLMLKHTDERGNFQGRYVLQHPYDGEFSCKTPREMEMLEEYIRQVQGRQWTESNTLARLTGWSKRDIRKRIRLSTPTRYR